MSTKKKKTSSQRQRRPSKPGTSRFRTRLWRVTLLLLGFGLGLLLPWVTWLDHVVTSEFEGRKWDLPSRVYARPLSLYPGMNLTPEALEAELEAAAYRRESAVSTPGSWTSRGSVYTIQRRSFDFEDGDEPVLRFVIDLSGGEVRRIEGPQGNLDLVRLDPAEIASIFPLHDEDRSLVALESAPPLLVTGLQAVEDRDFKNHPGIHWRGTLRALAANLKAGRTVQGGSTLTQQLAKNLFLTPERTLLRKFNEACMALLLELRFTKQAILTAYVNEVFLLQQNRIAIHGFARASRMLFRRSVDHLEPQQLALLVGMDKGPTRFNPFTRPAAALERRNLVLDIMHAQGIIGDDVHRDALAAPLGIVDRLPGVNPFPAYLDLVKRQLQSSYSSEELAARGMRIFTAFDPQVQRGLELGLARGLARFDQPELQAAVVIADYLSGDILALVGDRETDYPGFNRALMAQRPIGSLIKPLLLYSLLQGGQTLASSVVDEPIRIQQSDGKIWQPGNYDRELHGRMTLYEAFVHSYNLPFVHLGVDGGLEVLAQNLDKLTLLKHDVIYPSMLLGTTEMSSFEVAQMFQAIANNGYFTPLTTIRSVSDQHRQTLKRVPLESFKLFDQARMIQVQRAMIGVTESGTARYLAERFPGRTLAGKTGTTDEARDSWFAGFSRRLLAVVWLGRDDNQPIRLTGSSGALRVWADIMAGQVFESFGLSRDDRLSWRRIDPRDGGIVRQSCANGVLLPFPEDRVPRKRSQCP